MQIFVAGRLSHFVDGRSTAACWMSYINPARYSREQNLVAVQIPHNGKIDLKIAINLILFEEKNTNCSFYTNVECWHDIRPSVWFRSISGVDSKLGHLTRVG